MSQEPEVRLSDPTIGVTNLEPVEHKSAVQAYREYPTVELGDGVVGCEYCGYNRFRRSRVRFPDLFEAARMRFPMRCMRCSQRQYQSVDIFLLSAPAKSHGPRLAAGVDTWQNWTKSTPETPTSTRPMTTAVGTRAQRLAKPVAGAPRTASQPNPKRRAGDSDIW
jgi:DNA-directed RNA polymerase subunit RPC12/RpoP